MLSNQYDSDQDEMSAKLIVKNKIQITASQKKPIGEKSQSLAKNLNSLNSLNAHLTHSLSNSLDGNLDRNLHRSLNGDHSPPVHEMSDYNTNYNSDYNSNYQLADHNRPKANPVSHNGATLEPKLCDGYRLTFNGKLNNNDSDLDNLNAISAHPRTGAQNARQPKQPIKQPLKSTSFESSLTDDYNSEHSTEEIGGCFSMNNADSHSSNLEEDDVSFDKQPAEMEQLLDQRSIKDQKIVEVVSVCG